MRIRRVVLGAAVTLLLAPPLAAAPAPALPSPTPSATPVPTGGPVELPGEPVAVSTDPRSPTPLSAGTWRDTLGPAESADGRHEFSYRRAIDGSTVFVGVSGAAAEPGDQVSVEVRSEGDEDCGSDESSAGGSNSFGTFGAQVVAGADDPCLDVAELRITVGRGFSSAETDLPVALRIVEEAPVASDTTTLPVPAETLRPGPVPTDAEPVATVPGTGYDDTAPLLGPGRYDTTVLEGTQGFWRVRLGWGEQLTTRLEVPRQDAAALEAVGGAAPAVELVLVDPLLDTFRESVEGAEASGAWDTDEDTVLTDGSPPVGWPNRFDDTPATVPGEYWVTISVAEPTDRPALEVPMRLAVGVEPAASVEAVTPVFQDRVLGFAGATAPEGYAATTPYLLAEGVFAAEVPPPGSGGEQVADAGAAGDRSAPDDTRTVLALASGVGGAACLLVGLALLVRRRRTG